MLLHIPLDKAYRYQRAFLPKVGNHLHAVSQRLSFHGFHGNVVFFCQLIQALHRIAVEDGTGCLGGGGKHGLNPLHGHHKPGVGNGKAGFVQRQHKAGDIIRRGGLTQPLDLPGEITQKGFSQDLWLNLFGSGNLHHCQHQREAALPESQQGKGFLLTGSTLRNQQLLHQPICDGIGFLRNPQPGLLPQILLHPGQHLKNPAADNLPILGFQNVIGGLQADPLIGIGKIRIGSEQDHIAVGIVFLYDLRQLQTAHVRHPNVRNQKLNGVLLAYFQRLLPPERGMNLHIHRRFLLQNAPDGIHNMRLVIYNQDLKDHVSVSPIFRMTFRPPKSLAASSTPPAPPKNSFNRLWTFVRPLVWLSSVEQFSFC